MAVSIVPRSRAIEPKPLPNTEELTADTLRSILHYDSETGIFTRKVSTSNNTKVGDVAGTSGHRGYLYIGIRNRVYAAHRLAWLYVYSHWPSGQIDHINHTPTDNRITNLRDVSVKQNGQNRSVNADNKSGYPGVCWFKPTSQWQAAIKHNQRSIHLGRFPTIEEAIAARKAAEKLYWADTWIADTATV